MKQLRNRFFSLFLLICFLLPLGSSCITVQDPVELRNLNWAVGTTLPEASDFAVSLPNGAEIRYRTAPDATAVGEYTVALEVVLPDGKSRSYEAVLSLVEDREPPVISGVQPLVAYIGGSGISYRSGVTVSDNCNGSVSLEVDTSGVNLREEGSYTVFYTATDHAGNRTTVSTTVSVYRSQITEEMLYVRLDPLIAEITEPGMTREEQLRAVYNFVYERIAYTNQSDKSSWVRAAYEGLESGKGDCYTYFALAKAFLVRLGIPNLDVERSEKVAAQVGERHYWSMVNLGTEASPQWYHFDCCHLADMLRPWGCLMTDAQLRTYSRSRINEDGVSDYFYSYDKEKYPSSAERVLTKIDW